MDKAQVVSDLILMKQLRVIQALTAKRTSDQLSGDASMTRPRQPNSKPEWPQIADSGQLEDALKHDPVNMKVLLITTDLYRNIGGGQTVYKRIIESAPNVQFFYFRENEAADVQKPPNVTSIPLSVRLKLKVLSAPPFPVYQRHQLQEADHFARSVAGEHFDIVDIPDYYTFGSFLRDAFARHHVTVSRIVLAMHGNISVSIEMGWGSAGDNVLEQRMLERAQFEAADGVYAISPRYIREWQAVVNRPVYYLDPINLVDIPGRHNNYTAQTGLKPNLYCIGRTERRKGNDLFVELVRWLNPNFYGKATHIGDEVLAPSGVGTRYILWDIANKRDLKFDFLPSFTRDELSKLYREQSIIVLPVRYDSLNLIALEALFEGCPVAVSSEAGVCDYLDETFPGLPYVKIDFSNFYSAVSCLNDLNDRYDEHRKRLAQYLSTALPRLNTGLKIRAIYADILTYPSSAVSDSRVNIAYVEVSRFRLVRMWNYAKRLLPTEKYDATMRWIRSRREYLIRKLHESELIGDAKFLGVLADSRFVPSRLKRIAEHSEYNKGRLQEKLNEIYGNSTNPLYRCNFWLDIARIERILGNDLIAATYELRVIRLVGRDVFKVLPRIVSTLEAKGFTYEAEAAKAMYDDPANVTENVYRFLQESYQRNLFKRDLPFERIDDRRTGNPKVTIIVSLYKADSKLEFFITTLMQQTLVRQGKVEIIFVDSGSPDCEQQVIQQFWQKAPMNAVYARTAGRETIQMAWNRGIRLSHAPYLVFLGVDETLYPEALEVLASELDQNPFLDWVIGNSLVTAVDQRGIYKNDVMPYNRNGGTKDHAYLETCYLSWVGGMYRRSIHDRFGYYDETFGAAGDTEFKNRILPHINVGFIPKTLGLFLNYPDERTTASPRAEIEDSRAWYIHRTPGGIRYAFENRPLEDVERLLCAALGYRKSYCGHISSDIEFAKYLAAYLNPRGTISGVVAKDLALMLDHLRGLEFAYAPPTQLSCLIRLVRTWRCAATLQKAHNTALQGLANATYKVFNDNRYEQHSWLWRSSS